MRREYKDTRILRNVKIAKDLSVLSLILALVTTVAYVTRKYIVEKLQFGAGDIYFYFGLLLIPVYGVFLFSTITLKGNVQIGKETSMNNDYLDMLGYVVFSCIPWAVLLACFVVEIIALIAGTDASKVFIATRVVAYYVGWMLFSHLSLYFADGFLIQNCVLIKREWKENPPKFVIEEQLEQRQKKEDKKEKQNMKQYRSLIEQCGMKFFIKYYKQIARLPLRDVTVSENYTPEECNERLCAAKRLIDLGLTEFALNEILKNYCDVLDNTEIEQAKAILAELKAS